MNTYLEIMGLLATVFIVSTTVAVFTAILIAPMIERLVNKKETK